MKIALYANCEGSKMLTVKGAEIAFNEKKNRPYVKTEPVYIQVPGNKSIVIDKDNVTQWEFPTVNEAVDYFTTLTPLDGLMYSIILEDAEWTSKPTHLLSHAEVIAEMHKRTRRTPNNKIRENDAKVSLEALREIAGQVVTAKSYALPPTVADLRKARKSRKPTKEE